MSFKIYAAGPLAGTDLYAAQEWRDELRYLLKPFGIEVYSPLRKKDLDNPTADPLFGSDASILTRDHYDCKSADLVFVNLLGSKQISIGSVMEIAWAYAYGKPMVIASNTETYNHPMLNQITPFRVLSISEAIYTIKAILLPHTGEP